MCPEGQNRTVKHFTWLRAIQGDAILETEDQVVFGECLALLEYKPDRRDGRDRQIETRVLEPAYQAAAGRICCLKGAGRRQVRKPGYLFTAVDKRLHDSRGATCRCTCSGAGGIPLWGHARGAAGGDLGRAAADRR